MKDKQPISQQLQEWKKRNSSVDECDIFNEWGKFDNMIQLVEQQEQDIKEMLVVIESFTEKDTQGEEVLEKWKKRHL